MKSTCVLPPLSDILNPLPNQKRPSKRSNSVLQVSNLILYSEEEPIKAKRKRASPSQLNVLNKVFEQTFFPSTELRVELGKQLGMSPRTVQIWFQNKRQSIRTRERSVTISPPVSPQHDSVYFPSLPPIKYLSDSTLLGDYKI